MIETNQQLVINKQQAIEAMCPLPPPPPEGKGTFKMEPEDH